MSIKFRILFVACIIYIYAFDVAVGRPNHADTGLKDTGLEDTELEDTGLDINGTVPENKASCANRGGCYKGYCWAGCVALSPLVLSNSLKNNLSNSN